MTQERLTEIARTHGCLLARDGAFALNHHEKTSCDCTVLEFIAELSASEKDRDALVEFINALDPLLDAVEALDPDRGQS